MNARPSMRSVTGVSKRKDMIWMIMKRFRLSSGAADGGAPAPPASPQNTSKQNSTDKNRATRRLAGVHIAALLMRLAGTGSTTLGGPSQMGEPCWHDQLPMHQGCGACLPPVAGLDVGCVADMSFLDRTLRDWNVRLEPIADQKPVQLKVTCGSTRPTELPEGSEGFPHPGAMRVKETGSGSFNMRPRAPSPLSQMPLRHPG